MRIGIGVVFMRVIVRILEAGKAGELAVGVLDPVLGLIERLNHSRVV